MNCRNTVAYLHFLVILNAPFDLSLRFVGKK